MLNTLFDYLDVQVASGGKEMMPSEFLGTKRDAVDTNIRTSDLPIRLATHRVNWSNGGVTRPHVPSRINVPKNMMQEGQPPLDIPALRVSQMLLPSDDYETETVEHMKEMCRIRGITIGGNKEAVIARLVADDLRITALGERGEQGLDIVKRSVSYASNASSPLSLLLFSGHGNHTSE